MEWNEISADIIGIFCMKNGFDKNAWFHLKRSVLCQQNSFFFIFNFEDIDTKRNTYSDQFSFKSDEKKVTFVIIV